MKTGMRQWTRRKIVLNIVHLLLTKLSSMMMTLINRYKTSLTMINTLMIIPKVRNGDNTEVSRRTTLSES